MTIPALRRNTILAAAALLAATLTHAASTPGHAQGADAAKEAATEEARAEQDSRNYQLQYSMGYFSSYNTADPFLDLTKAGNSYWTIEQNDGPTLSFSEAVTQGYLDPDTGLPRSLPANARAVAKFAVLHGMRDHPRYFAGGYTMEWEGEGYGFLDGQPRDMQRRIGTNKLSFHARQDRRHGVRIKFSQVRGEGVRSIRLYKNEHKELIDAGEIWNPDFIEHMRRYDVIRTMDFQRINTSPVTKFSEVARPEDPFYVNARETEWPAPARYGMPYEVLFDLAQKADAALWLHIPPMIGSPLHPAHPSLRSEEGWVSGGKLSRMASENARAIVDSPEWEIFAGELADRLVASGYDADTPLYIEIGNEIWNWSSPFGVNTSYFDGIGKGLHNKHGHRYAYGVVLARFAHLFENALKARGVSHNTVYVIASHTANPSSTTVAINGFKAKLDALDADAEALIAKTGVTLTTYTRCSKGFGANRFNNAKGEALARAWENAINENPEQLKRDLHDYCLNATVNHDLNVNKLLTDWRRQHAEIERQGMRLIGAYEGGSHDWPRDLLNASETFRDWWRDYHWGPYGADVVRQTSLAIIEEFPGVMLSDFDSIGPIGGLPWFEGHYSEETDLMRVWDEFARPR